MPNRPLKQCSHYGCPNLTNERFCPAHKKEDQPYASVQNRATAHERGYDRRWQKVRVDYLRHNPLCVECRRKGQLTPSIVVDHITPHRGDRQLFWDPANWQALCAACHNIKTAKELQR
jgi:5-methylcytosine-specific restriction protein A